MNDYFNHSANVIAAGIRALAAQVNNIATEIGTGLDLLPTEIQLKRGTTRYAVDTGAADAYVVALPYTPALADGLEVTFRAINTSTGASTINVNALGAKAIVLFNLTALAAGAIVANSIVTVRYSSVGDHFVLMSGAIQASVSTFASGITVENDIILTAANPRTIQALGTTGFTFKDNNATTVTLQGVTNDDTVRGKIFFTTTAISLATSGSVAMVTAKPGAEVELYHNGTLRAETSALGFAVGSATAAEQTLHRNVDTGPLTVTGGNGPTSGARITLNGGSKAGDANDLGIGAGTDGDWMSWDDSAGSLTIAGAAGASKTTQLIINGTGLGFFGTAAAAKPTITGSRGGNVALADLLTELATLGLITDSSS